MGTTERAALIRRLEERRGSKVICYLTSDRANAGAQVNKDVIPLMFEHIRGLQERPRIDILIHTAGGDTLAAFGLARLIREFSDEVTVLVAHRCHSAGTLFALGANRIVMTPLATLSPIDPSITTPLNPAIKNANQVKILPMSVESVAGFRALVKEHWNIGGDEHVAGMLKLLVERVHPLALGDVYRATQQIEFLATKLLKHHRNDEETITGIVRTLTKGLGSHDYPISRSEARTLLDAQVHAADADLESLVFDLYADFAREMLLDTPYDAGQLAGPPQPNGRPGEPVHVVNKMAFVESLHGSHVAERDVTVTAVAIPSPLGPQAGITEQVNRAGWRFETVEGRAA